MTVNKSVYGTWMVDLCHYNDSGTKHRFRKSGFKTRKEAERYELNKKGELEAKQSKIILD